LKDVGLLYVKFQQEVVFVAVSRLIIPSQRRCP